MGSRNVYRVFCNGTKPINGRYGLFYCAFGGYRMAITREVAEKKPCPRCGGPVTAHKREELK